MPESGILTQTSESYRTKARAIQAMAAAATDGVIAAELRVLADRYLTRALELEAEAPPGARAGPPARPKRLAAARSSLGAAPDDP